MQRSHAVRFTQALALVASTGGAGACAAGNSARSTQVAEPVVQASGTPEPSLELDSNTPIFASPGTHGSGTTARERSVVSQSAPHAPTDEDSPCMGEPGSEAPCEGHSKCEIDQNVCVCVHNKWECYSNASGPVPPPDLPA